MAKRKVITEQLGNSQESTHFTMTALKTIACVKCVLNKTILSGQIGDGFRSSLRVSGSIQPGSYTTLTAFPQRSAQSPQAQRLVVKLL